MTCKKCGRRISDNAIRCRGCGTYTDFSDMPVREQLSRLMKMKTKLGKLMCWQLLVVTLVLAAALSVGAIAGPTVYGVIKNAVSNIELPSDEQEAPPSKLETVSKTGQFLYVDLGDAAVDCDEQYSDGSYKLHAVLNNAVDIYVYRHAPLGIYNQIARLYPDIVEQPEVFDDGTSIGDLYVSRAQIAAVYTKNGCVVDIIFLTDGEYDHMLVIETPGEDYLLHSAAIEHMVNSIAMYEMVYDTEDAAV